MTDDSDMDVRLGMEGSASLAAESTWPPWEDKAGIRTARTQLGWADAHCPARGCICGHI